MEPETRHDLEATVAARRELGREHEDDLIDGFIERLDRRLAERRSLPAAGSRGLEPSHRFVLTIVTLGCAIPLLGIAGGTAGLPGVIVFAIALVAVTGIIHKD